MNNIPEFIQNGFAPLFMSFSDMLLLFYLCSGTKEYIRKNKSWGWWFAFFIFILVVSQFIFNGKTTGQANFLVFYTIHFLVLLAFSAQCTDAPLSARFYLVILSVLANDICLILFISASYSIFGIDFIDVGPFWVRVIAHFVLLALKFYVTVLMKKVTRKQIYGIETVFQAVIIMLPALPYFFLRDYAYFFKIDPSEVPMIIHYLDVLFGIFALINMIMSEQLSYRIRQNDLIQVENLIKKQHDQYLSTLNTIETVNRKYHDLRHILRGIESMHSVPEIKSFVKAIENEIQDYELIFNTGNKTLDIILSERMRESKEKGTQMHVHADGQGWEAIRDTDIATIFGNALDNALESTIRTEDIEKRFIDVRTGRVNDMLIARFENQFTHPLVKKQSKLISTKQDAQNHGYGLQSIEMVVKKYGGEVDINTENGAFVLTLIIPVEQDLPG